MLAVERKRLDNNRRELKKQEVQRLKYQLDMTRHEADEVEKQLLSYKKNNTSESRSTNKEKAPSDNLHKKKNKISQMRQMCSLLE